MTLALFSSLTAPAIDDYVSEAKLVRARHDVRVLATSLVRLFSDVSPERHRERGFATYDLLIGPGLIPAAATDGAAGWTTEPAAGRVGLLDDHLIRNGPGYSRRAGALPGGWRGAYLEHPVPADPWGHRFAVNMQSMRGAGADIVVLSPGADGVVSAPFAVDGLPHGGDDIVGLVSSDGVAP